MSRKPLPQLNLFHISAECYPAAKAGGLGDVVGALPNLQTASGQKVTVVLPAYQTPWIEHAKKTKLFEGQLPFNMGQHPFHILQVEQPVLGFRLFLVDVPGWTDRPGIYLDPWSGASYWDERERFLVFQMAFLEWITSNPKERGEGTVFHCHDHHAALIPFMVEYCNRYGALKGIPTVLTIHNGEYHGEYSLEFHTRLPAFPIQHLGLLDWDGRFNSLAAGIKCAWRVTTVSPGYLDELCTSSNGLERLLQHEKTKTIGILNGIDTSVWNPAKDPMIHTTYTSKSVQKGKEKNKKALTEYFQLDPSLPLFAFIGRLVREKGADLLPDLIRKTVREGLKVNFIVLGTGERHLHEVFDLLKGDSLGYFDSRLEYNESLAHLIYAGSDFLLMPSRVEPCGLNQMYAMRYGSIPIVRAVGGLKDTVPPIRRLGTKVSLASQATSAPPASSASPSSPPSSAPPASPVGKTSAAGSRSHTQSSTSLVGRGFVFEEFSLEQSWRCIQDAASFFGDQELFQEHRTQLMGIDFSWERSAREYENLYRSLTS